MHPDPRSECIRAPLTAEDRGEGRRALRLFVAVNLPASVRRRLGRLTDELESAELPVRWTPRENFHVTLRWLGERSADDRDEIARIMSDVARNTDPFEAGFGPLGAFPSPRRPRVIWIAVEGGPRLRLLRDELERRLAAAGYGRDERSFRPHVTLGRARRGAAPGAFRPFVALSGNLGLEDVVTVRKIDLMRSVLGPGSARYESQASAQLGGQGLPGGNRRG